MAWSDLTQVQQTKTLISVEFGTSHLLIITMILLFVVTDFLMTIVRCWRSFTLTTGMIAGFSFLRLHIYMYLASPPVLPARQ